MRTIALIALAAAGLSACAPPFVHRGPKVLKPVSRLECPPAQGQLSRASASADGMSCVYTGPGGASVQLKLQQVSGDPEALLQPIEAQLKAELPPAPPLSAASSSPPRPAGDDKVDIHVPGVSIQATNQGADIRVPGVHIDADDQHNSVHISGQGPGPGQPPGRGQFTVDANDSGAVIHARSFGPNFSERLILVSNTPGPQGWRTVGYDAMGPRPGPLVIATVQAKSNEHEQLFGDVEALVRKAAKG
jgi:hypothetical protein